jgi:hypothetical protein
MAKPRIGLDEIQAFETAITDQIKLIQRLKQLRTEAVRKRQLEDLTLINEQILLNEAVLEDMLDTIQIELMDLE